MEVGEEGRGSDESSLISVARGEPSSGCSDRDRTDSSKDLVITSSGASSCDSMDYISGVFGPLNGLEVVWDSSGCHSETI